MSDRESRRDAAIERLNSPAQRQKHTRIAQRLGAPDAERAVQDAWEGVIKRYDTAEGIERTIATSIANRAKDQGRRTLTPGGRMQKSLEALGEESGHTVDVVDTRQPDPHQIAAYNETLGEVTELLHAAPLSTNQRYILARTAQEAHDDEIAQELGWDGLNRAARVRTELSRAQAKMRETRAARNNPQT